jgi:small subunit ribosomal protein S16
VGSRKNPVWRVVVADQRSPRDGRVIETVGRYNPQREPSEIVLNRERIDHWVSRGAQPSGTVKKLMRADERSTPPASAVASPASARESDAPEAAKAPEAADAPATPEAADGTDAGEGPTAADVAEVDGPDAATSDDGAPGPSEEAATEPELAEEAATEPGIETGAAAVEAPPGGSGTEN